MLELHLMNIRLQSIFAQQISSSSIKISCDCEKSFFLDVTVGPKYSFAKAASVGSSSDFFFQYIRGSSSK